VIFVTHSNISVAGETLEDINIILTRSSAYLTFQNAAGSYTLGAASPGGKKVSGGCFVPSIGGDDKIVTQFQR
jgi:hypothetical protein